MKTRSEPTLDGRLWQASRAALQPLALTLALLVGLAAPMAQAQTHTVTLHPGDHGSIAGANSGDDYVITVNDGDAFPSITVNPDAGWSFTGWNPAAPATVTENYTATAMYAANPTSSHFQLIEGSFTWHEAKADAEARGGHLATFASEEEWQRMLSEVGSNAIGNRGVSLGATDEVQEGLWKWVTGEPWVYTSWTPGDPNNYLGIENYLMTWGAANGHRWADVPASATAAYILELPSGTPLTTHPDLSLTASDFRILNSSGAETANPATGDTVTLEVTVRNTGETNTSGMCWCRFSRVRCPPT